MGPDRAGGTPRKDAAGPSPAGRSRSDAAAAPDEMVVGFLGFLVGLAPLVWAATAVLVFGFALEYETSWIDLMIWVPPGAIAFAGAVPASGRPWRMGFRVGLLASAFASLMLGVYGLVLVASIAAGYGAGTLIGRTTRGRRPRPPAAVDPFAWTRRGR